MDISVQKWFRMAFIVLSVLFLLNAWLIHQRTETMREFGMFISGALTCGTRNRPIQLWQTPDATVPVKYEN